MKNLAVCLIIFFTLILAGCFPSTRSQEERNNALRLQEISAESLLVLSRAVEQRFQNHSLIFADEELEKYLDEVLDRMISPRERERYNLKVRILRSHTVNAFGYPHGTIFINVSLLAKLDNEARLAAVLSHELIHIVNSHAEKTLKKLKERSSMDTPHPELASLFGDEIYDGGGGAALSAAVRGYSRELEREADSLGLLRMVEAGYPPGEFLSLLLFLRDYAASEEISETTFFNSHPRITERVRNYHRIIGGNGSHYVYAYKNGEAFRKQIKKAVYEDVRVSISAQRYDEASTQIEKLLEADSCDSEALTLQGDFERNLSPRSTDFFNWYERGLECDPRNIAALRAVGFAYYSIGNFQEARKYLSRYCDIAETAADIGTARLMLDKCGEHTVDDKE